MLRELSQKGVSRGVPQNQDGALDVDHVPSLLCCQSVRVVEDDAICDSPGEDRAMWEQMLMDAFLDLGGHGW